MKIPKLSYFKARGLAYVNLGKKKVYLGKWGDPETARKYAQFVDALVNGNVCGEEERLVTIADLSASFFESRRDYYKSNQLTRFKAAFEYLLRMYSDLPVDELGPKRLLIVRNEMMASERYARAYLNTLMNCIKHVFKYGVEHELVKVETLHALQTLTPLKRGRTSLREHSPIKPVDPADVEKTVSFLTPTLAAMVQLQRLTGMRPGEVCIMRSRDVDTTVQPWIYTLSHDKTDYRREVGDKRTIPLGERAQRVIAPFLERDYLFSPNDSQEERGKARRDARMTPLTAQTRLRDQRQRKKYNETYSVDAYRRAIAYACKQAGVAKWSPNQLRHLYATEIRAKYGLEAAQIMLGHSNAKVTQIYAERDREKAIEIAIKEG